MTRFEKELSGALGPFWQKDAERRLAQVKADLEAGRITIDEAGVARNCIGRVLMDDQMELLIRVTDRANAEATHTAREAEVEAELAEYRANYKGPSAEELAEMRAAFGPGATVVNVITGKKIKL